MHVVIYSCIIELYLFNWEIIICKIGKEINARWVKKLLQRSILLQPLRVRLKYCWTHAICLGCRAIWQLDTKQGMVIQRWKERFSSRRTSPLYDSLWTECCCCVHEGLGPSLGYFDNFFLRTVFCFNALVHSMSDWLTYFQTASYTPNQAPNRYTITV